MIFTIFRKELKDTLRDRRTLMTMLVIPVLIFPMILSIFVSVSESFQAEAAQKEIKIGYVAPENSIIVNELNEIPKSFGKKKLIAFKDSVALKQAVRNDSIAIGLLVPINFQQSFDANRTGSVTIFYPGTEVGMQERAEGYMEIIDGILKKERFSKLNIDQQSVTPLQVNYSNISSGKEMIGKLAGGVLPYIFIAFGFIGCMYPAIDLFTGEKERGTIETLLTTPVARWQILFGKMGVIVLSGLLAASCAMLGLFFSIEVMQLVKDPELLEIIHSILTLKFVIMMFSLLVPLTIFFAGIMTPIAVYAKTFKEAQSIITPINILVVLPAMVGFFPGIELNAITAMIPVVNIVLATKELIAGTLDFGLLALAFGVMTFLAIAAVVFSYKQFDKETNVVAS